MESIPLKALIEAREALQEARTDLWLFGDRSAIVIKRCAMSEGALTNYIDAAIKDAKVEIEGAPE